MRLRREHVVDVAIALLDADGLDALTMRKLATDAGLQDPQAVTDRLMLVVNGLRASGAALGTPAVTTAVSLAKDIVRSAAPAA